MMIFNDVISKEDLRELFRDFFIFHNNSNKNTVAVDDYFEKWYNSRFNIKKNSSVTGIYIRRNRKK